MKYLLFIYFILLSFHCTMGQSSKKALSLKDTSYTSKSGMEIKAEIGSLKIPENRANPNSEDIAIHFIRLKSNNPNPQTPLIYLEGGPGSSCTWMVQAPDYLEVWGKFLALGDVILLDQRGTGQGRNRVLYIHREELPENILVDKEVTRKHMEKVKRSALETFKERGVDLAGYTSVQNATDIDDLRKVLGYNKISLLGFSYGTHLAQTYIKYFGNNLDNVVLIGTEGLNHTFKLPSTMETHFKKIALLSDADANVNQEVPDFMALYRKVTQKLDKNPVELEVNSPLTREPLKIKVDAFGLNRLIRYDIGDASDIPVFTRLLYSIDQGDYAILTWFLQKRMGGLYGIQGMASTMDLASGATATRRQRIREENEKSFFKGAINIGLDSDWPAPDLGDEFREPLITNVRTLFMSGTLDFNTPPYQAEEVRWGFSNSSHIIVGYAGHEQVIRHPDSAEAIFRFLKGENVDDVAFSYPKIRFIPVKGDTGDLWHPSMGE